MDRVVFMGALYFGVTFHGGTVGRNTFTRRVRRVLESWSELDSAQYSCRGRPDNFESVIETYWAGLCDTWLSERTARLEADVRDAVAAYERASRADLVAKGAQALKSLAQEDVDFRATERFSDSRWLTVQTSLLDDASLEAVATGCAAPLVTQLSDWLTKRP
jgi:hypothetical protein